MTKIKICGLKSARDIELAKDSDIFGFIVNIPLSARNLSIAQAKELIEIARKYGEVAVVTTDLEKITELAIKLKPDILQIHARLSEKKLKKLRKTIAPKVKIVPAISISPEQKDIDSKKLQTIKRLAQCSDALLLDTVKSSVYGKPHSWKVSKKIRDYLYPFPIILAGGLNPKNVQKAIKLVRPYAVDATSGVERAVGIKDQKKVKDFIIKVRTMV